MKTIKPAYYKKQICCLQHQWDRNHKCDARDQNPSLVAS